VPCKLPLTLQESGIFVEEDERTTVQVANRSTQTKAPSGELLQEVQRLHELRVKLQQRATIIKKPILRSTDSLKICFDLDSMAQEDNENQDHIRKLEIKLKIYEQAEKKREQEKKLRKQREEELIDDNYKLLEKIHTLENKLQIVQSPIGKFQNLKWKQYKNKCEAQSIVKEHLQDQLNQDNSKSPIKRTRGGVTVCI